jgi:hypothetical protein
VLLRFVFFGAALLALGPVGAASSADFYPFIQKYCAECHDADSRKGDLELTTLRPDFANPNTFSIWVKVHDRVSAGEMPPAKKARPAPKDLARFTNSLCSSLLAADRARVAEEGRAVRRRLNRYEYEESLRDLLSLPNLQVKDYLPEDSEAHGFNKVGEALDVSHVQMARYLAAAEFALRQAMAPQVQRPQTTTVRYHTWDDGEFFGRIKLDGPYNRRTFPLVGYDLQRALMDDPHPKRPTPRDPARTNLESMAVVCSTYEPTEIRFGNFRAPVSGRYHLRFSGYSVWMGSGYKEVTPGRQSEPVCIYSEIPPRALRKLGSFDFSPEPTERELDVWLLAGETIRPDAARLFRSRPPDHKNPLEQADGMPGVAFSWMEVEGPLVSEWPPAGHQLLFGDLPLKPATGPPGRTMADAQGDARSAVEVVSAAPERDAARLLRRFLQHAYRAPAPEGEPDRFLSLTRRALSSGYSFADALIASYTAVLSSPDFLYLGGQPGRLDDWALAERLSYFLWNSPPDNELRALAQRGDLHRPKILHAQTERLLSDPRSRRFINAFLDYWLDLRFITGTAPDSELYPDYQLDDLLAESMIDETQLFFADLLQNNLPVTNLVASDFAILNRRLATHYGIANVQGVELRSVPLGRGSVRGGLLTQGSVLKVTANGTTTSPVKRGAWIMTRLLGKPPPPPPPSVRAIDPDTRGATTIREQLAKHRDQPSCAACHRNIDPAGFALESFDVMGAWRERYRSLGQGDPVKGVGHNGNLYHFCLGPKVDSTGEMPDGRPFQDVRQLKQYLAADRDQLARNLVQQLTVYSTGGAIRFSDRPVIENILRRSRPSGYGVRTLVHELVQSEIFLKK